MRTKDHTITITAVSVQERNKRVRDLLTRGYMPIHFYDHEEQRRECQATNYKDAYGGTRRMHKEESWQRYCVVMRRRGAARVTS